MFKKFLLALILGAGLAAPAHAIDANCTTTPNLGIYDCPDDSEDWYESYEGILDQLDALAKTAKSSFTVTTALQVGTVLNMENGQFQQWKDSGGTLRAMNGFSSSNIMEINRHGSFHTNINPNGGLVIIGASGTPLHPLHLYGSLSQLVLQDSDNPATWEGGDKIGDIGFKTSETSAPGANVVVASMSVRHALSRSGDGYPLPDIAFFTRGTSGNLTEKMTIEYDGNVGIGATNPTANLHVATNTAVAKFTSYSLGDDESVALETVLGASGIMLITGSSNSGFCIYSIRGAENTSSEGVDMGGKCVNTDTDGSLAIFPDGDSTYTMRNRTGSSIIVSVWWVGF